MCKLYVFLPFLPFPISRFLIEQLMAIQKSSQKAEVQMKMMLIKEAINPRYETVFSSPPSEMKVSFISLHLCFTFSLIALALGHRGSRGPPLTFLHNLPVDARKEFLEIVQGSGTKGELKGKLAEWAEQNGIEEDFDKFMRERRAKAEQLQDTANGNLSGQALQLFTEIWQINQNDELTFLQDCQNISRSFRKADPVVRNIVASLLPPPSLPGPLPHGCPPLFGPIGGHGRHGSRGHHGHGRRGGKFSRGNWKSKSEENGQLGMSAGNGNGQGSADISSIVN